MTVKTWTAAALALAGTVLAALARGCPDLSDPRHQVHRAVRRRQRDRRAGPHRRRPCLQDTRAVGHHREHRRRQWRAGRPERGARRARRPYGADHHQHHARRQSEPDEDRALRCRGQLRAGHEARHHQPGADHRPAVPAKTVEELIAHAKANPGKLTFGYGSSSSRIAGEMLRTMGGIDIRPVPYKSNPQAITDLLGGQIDIIFADLSTTLPQVKAGKARGWRCRRPSAARSRRSFRPWRRLP